MTPSDSSLISVIITYISQSNKAHISQSYKAGIGSLSLHQLVLNSLVTNPIIVSADRWFDFAIGNLSLKLQTCISIAHIIGIRLGFHSECVFLCAYAYLQYNENRHIIHQLQTKTKCDQHSEWHSKMKQNAIREITIRITFHPRGSANTSDVSGQRDGNGHTNRIFINGKIHIEFLLCIARIVYSDIMVKCYRIDVCMNNGLHMCYLICLCYIVFIMTWYTKVMKKFRFPAIWAFNNFAGDNIA